MTRYAIRQIVGGTALVLLMLSLSWSDSLTLRDGRHIDGKYIGGSSAVIGFVTNGAVQYFPVADVMAVVFGDSGVDSPLGTLQPNSLRRRLRKPAPRLGKSSQQQLLAFSGKRGVVGVNAVSPAKTLLAGDHMYRLLAASLAAGSTGVISPVR